MGTIIKGKTVIGPNIVTDGLELLLDAGSDRSYPGSGAVYYDLSGGGNNGVIMAQHTIHFCPPISPTTLQVKGSLSHQLFLIPHQLQCQCHHGLI